MNKFEVEIEKDGKLFRGYATVSGGMLTVQTPELGSKSATVSANNDALAKLLLWELINQSIGKGW